MPVGRSPQGERRERHGRCPQCRDEPESREPPDGIVLHDERVTTPPEQPRAGPAEQGLFDIEALENVEAPDDDEQRESALQSAAAPLEEVEADDGERSAHHECSRMRERWNDDRLEPEKQSCTRGHVRRDGRRDVRGRRDECGRCRDDRQAVAAPRLSQPGEPTMDADPPAPRVAERGH